MHKSKNVEIRKYTTMGVGGKVEYFLIIKNKQDVLEAINLAKTENLPIVVLGEGSNMIFTDGTLGIVVLKIEISGFDIIKEDDVSVEIKIGAGENWDSVVARTVTLNYAGIEALSAIPGTTGATPFQNVGAYGQEIKDVLDSVEVYDTHNNSFVVLSNADCKFGYRDSIFRSSEKGRYIIMSVTMRLSKLPPVLPNYPDVIKYFSDKENSPSLLEIRNSIIEIRARKLPNPNYIKNNGSFFKNPIVDMDLANKVILEYPNIVNYPAGEGLVKFSAGWLIEQCGLKGVDLGEMKVYEKNALVLVNKGKANFKDLEQAKDLIIEKVKDKFGIALEPEPIFVE